MDDRTGVEVPTMNPLWVGVLVLLAVFVGLAIPVLLQLRQTLKTLNTTLIKTGRRLDEALDEVSDAARRVTSLGKELEEGATRLRVLFDVAGDLGHALGKFRDAVNVASAAASSIGPTVVAAAQSLFSSRSDGKTEPASQKEAVPQNPGSGARPEPKPLNEETRP